MCMQLIQVATASLQTIVLPMLLLFIRDIFIFCLSHYCYDFFSILIRAVERLIF